MIQGNEPEKTKDTVFTNRRTVLAATGAAVSLSGCSGTNLGGGSDTIKIGFALPYSGGASVIGEAIEKGFKLHTEQELDGEINGAEVEYVAKDTQFSPDTGTSVTRSLIQEEQIDILIGPVSSGVAIAMLPVVSGTDVVWLNVQAGNANIIRNHCDQLENFFNTSDLTWHWGYPFGTFVYNNIADSAATIYSDYAAGQQQDEFFAQSFTEAGGEIATQIPVPPGSDDFSSQIDKLKNSDAGAVFAFFPGAAGVTFIKQSANFGLKEEMAITGGGSMTTRPFLPAVADTVVDMYSALQYTSTRDLDETRSFIQNFREQHDTVPGYFACEGYQGALLLSEAVGSAGGFSKDELVAEIPGMEIQSPSGPIKIEPETHSATVEMDIRQVVEAPDSDLAVEGVENEVIEVIENSKSPSWDCDLT